MLKRTELLKYAPIRKTLQRFCGHPRGSNTSEIDLSETRYRLNISVIIYTLIMGIKVKCRHKLVTVDKLLTQYNNILGAEG